MSIVTEDKIVGGNFVGGYTKDGVQYICKSMSIWRSLRVRCKNNSSFQLEFPTYVGCCMSDNFKDFQTFARWYSTQIGYNISGYQIDKDILVRGNKIYGEHTCVLVPPVVNMFFVKRPTKSLPTGVQKSAKGYSSSIRLDGVWTNLGNFRSITEAENAYILSKEDDASRLYYLMEIGDIVVDDRVKEVFRTYKYL